MSAIKMHSKVSEVFCQKRAMLKIKLKINLKKHPEIIPVKESYIYYKISLWADSDFFSFIFLVFWEAQSY